MTMSMFVTPTSVIAEDGRCQHRCAEIPFIGGGGVTIAKKVKENNVTISQHSCIFENIRGV